MTSAQTHPNISLFSDTAAYYLTAHGGTPAARWNDAADFNLLLTEKTFSGQEEQLLKLDDEFQSSKVDAIFCVAGGWAGGNAASKGK